MSFIDQLRTIKRMDELIHLKATGNQKEFAEKLGLSRSAFFRNLNILKQLNAPIAYCSHQECYYYLHDFKFIF